MKAISLPQMDRQQWIAALLIFLASICFSAKAVLVKLAYRYEIDSVSLLTLRMLFSLPFFLVVAHQVGRKPSPYYRAPAGKEWVTIVLLGISGYYLASLFDFLGLQYIMASLERLILYIYPTLVLLLSRIFLRQRISKAQYIALGLTYLGILVAFSERLFVPEDGQFLWGAFLVFLSALTFALYFIGSGRLLPRLGTWRFTSYTMTIAALMILLHHGLVFHWRLFHFPAPVYRLAFLMAIISTVLPTFLTSEGIRRIGAGNAAIVGSAGPISTIVMARIFLDEQLGMLQWLGALLVIGGVLLISIKKKR